MQYTFDYFVYGCTYFILETCFISAQLFFCRGMTVRPVGAYSRIMMSCVDAVIAYMDRYGCMFIISVALSYCYIIDFGGHVCGEIRWSSVGHVYIRSRSGDL